MTNPPTSVWPDPECVCLKTWESLGRLYGVDMGRGWVRTTTDPGCPRHGADAPPLEPVDILTDRIIADDADLLDRLAADD